MLANILGKERFILLCAPLRCALPFKALSFVGNAARCMPGASSAFLNVWHFRECIPKGGTIKTDYVLTAEMRHNGVAHIRLLAASISSLI
jgi:hypothetical protein